MKLVITEFVTLDGVSQGPGAPDEDTTGGFTHGGWLVPYFDAAFVRFTSRALREADGLLLGRRTYEAFGRDWPRITDPDDPYTELMNTLPKYVVSNTLTEGTWHPVTVLPGDPVRTVAELKARPGRELQVHGSARLGATLLAAGLIDTLRLVVAPAVLRTGRRFLAEADSGAPTGLRLVHHEATPSGLLLLEYEPVEGVAQARYEGVGAFA